MEDFLGLILLDLRLPGRDEAYRVRICGIEVLEFKIGTVENADNAVA